MSKLQQVVFFPLALLLCIIIIVIGFVVVTTEKLGLMNKVQVFFVARLKRRIKASGY